MCRPIYYVLVLQLATINKTLRVLIRSMAMTMIIYDDTINLETKDAQNKTWAVLERDAASHKLSRVGSSITLLCIQSSHDRKWEDIKVKRQPPN